MRLLKEILASTLATINVVGIAMNVSNHTGVGIIYSSISLMACLVLLVRGRD